VRLKAVLGHVIHGATGEPGRGEDSMRPTRSGESKEGSRLRWQHKIKTARSAKGCAERQVCERE
jgi:hypothetical protein